MSEDYLSRSSRRPHSPVQLLTNLVNTKERPHQKKKLKT